jgi:hypothetical protein
MNFLEFHENSNGACFFRVLAKKLQHVFGIGTSLGMWVFLKKLNALKRFLTKNVITQWHAMFNK